MNSLSLRTERKTFVKGAVKFTAKAVISLAIMAWMLSNIPLNKLGSLFIECSWPYLAISFLVVNMCMLVSALKWRPLLTIHKIRIPFLSVLSSYYAALFANNFLPSSIGGDALRIYDAAHISGKPTEAAASVIMERLLASLALAFTAAGTLAFLSGIEGNGFIYSLVAGIMAICMAITVWLFFYPFKESGKLGRWFCKIGHYKRYPGILGKVLLYSFIFQGLLVLSNYYAFMALGLSLPLIKHFLYIPVIMAVSMLPVSINGLGVREGMYVLLYGFAGVEPAAAISCSLLFFMLVTITSMFGGVIIILRR